MPPLPNAAELLEGVELGNGWSVVRRIPRRPGATGGKFSIPYEVLHDDGRVGFMKALDYSKAFLLPPAEVPGRLNAMTEEFLFEVEMVSKCIGLSRVVTALDSGAIEIPNTQYPTVNYLIFEMASGDLRTALEHAARLDVVWRLRTIHQVATGLQQLHSRGIYHQDLKPSNVLNYGAADSKLADLGRSVSQDVKSPFEALPIPGDWGHAPLELLYRHSSLTSDQRRRGCDAYHLGSLAFLLFAGTAMTPAILSQLDPHLHWKAWSGPYPDVLPFLRSAFNLAMVAIRLDEEPRIGADLAVTIRELCDPDPDLRGSARARSQGANPLDVRRYVTKFDLLARTAEARVRGSSA